MIHKPKHITSKEGLGLNTTKQLDFITDTLAIGTELWGTISDPWAESGTVIAKEGYLWRTKWEAGKSYIITKMYDDSRNLVGVYADISRPVERDGKGFAFDDLYLDVWFVPGQTPIILDIDELQEAVKQRLVAESEARHAYETAKDLAARMTRGEESLDF